VSEGLLFSDSVALRTSTSNIFCVPFSSLAFWVAPYVHINQLQFLHIIYSKFSYADSISVRKKHKWKATAKVTQIIAWKTKIGFYKRLLKYAENPPVVKRAHKCNLQPNDFFVLSESEITWAERK